MWDFLIIDAHELLRQKVGIFSVSALLLCHMAVSGSHLPYDGQVKFPLRGV